MNSEEFIFIIFMNLKPKKPSNMKPASISVLFYVTFFSILNYSCTSQNKPNNLKIDWVKTNISESQRSSKAIHMDSKGNVYYSKDMSIIKMDATGKTILETKIPGAGNSAINDFTIDLDGNIYITGFYSGTGDFDPGPGVFNLYGTAEFYKGFYENAFILKLNNNGDFVWAKSHGGIGCEGCEGRLIAISPKGEVYIAGEFFGTTDFDPSPGKFNLTSGNYRNHFYEDIFISKLDASGEFIWAKSMGGNLRDIVNAISLDPSGNVYTTGSFMETADFNPGLETFNLSVEEGRGDVEHAFLSKLDSKGDFVWAKKISRYDYGKGMAIAIDASENILLTGKSSILRDEYRQQYDECVYIAKFDKVGEKVWSKEYIGFDIYSGAVALDHSNRIYLVGAFKGTVDFDPDTSTYNLISTSDSTNKFAPANYDGFISILDSDGKFISAFQFGGIKSDAISGVALDESANLYAKGVFEGVVNFEKNSDKFKMNSENGSLFILKMKN